MDPAWIGVIGTLAGGTLVGALGIFAKHIEISRNQREEVRKYRLQRLEKMHEILTNLIIAARERCEVTTDLVIFGKSLDERILATNATTVAIVNPLPAIFSLQSLYAPELEKYRDDTMMKATAFAKQCALYSGSESMEQGKEDLDDAFRHLVTTLSRFSRGVELRILIEQTPRPWFRWPRRTKKLDLTQSNKTPLIDP